MWTDEQAKTNKCIYGITHLNAALFTVDVWAVYHADLSSLAELGDNEAVPSSQVKIQEL